MASNPLKNMDRRKFMIFAGALPAVPFVASKDETKEPVIGPKNFALTTGLCMWDKVLSGEECQQLPHFSIESTDAEEVRQRLISSFDRTMLGHLDGLKARAAAIQYLANRNDPRLNDFYYDMLHAKDDDVGVGDPVRASIIPRKKL